MIFATAANAFSYTHKGSTLNYYLQWGSTTDVYVSSASSIASDGNLEIPAIVTDSDKTYTVTSIDEEAFEGDSELKSVTIPSSVKSIGQWAFNGCSNLTIINFEDGLESIGEQAFYGCGVKELVLPSTIRSVGADAFNSCTDLQSVIISEGATELGSAMFYYCTNLKYAYIPSTITNYNNGNVFCRCSNLETVEVGEGLQSLGDSNFSGTAITYFVVPESVTTLEGAFNGCEKLEAVILHDNITAIGDYAFCYCKSLTSISIPQSVKTIGSYAFSNAGLTTVVIPNSVTSIAQNAFSDNASLTSVYIPNSVKSIGMHAFRDNPKLEYIRFGSGISSLPNYVLANDQNLKVIEMSGNVPSTTSSTFYNFPANAEIQVPVKFLNDYKNNSAWNSYNIATRHRTIEITPETEYTTFWWEYPTLIPNDVTLYYTYKFVGGYLILTQVEPTATVLQANTGVIVQRNSNALSNSFDFIEAPEGEGTEIEVRANWLTGKDIFAPQTNNFTTFADDPDSPITFAVTSTMAKSRMKATPVSNLTSLHDISEVGYNEAYLEIPRDKYEAAGSPDVLNFKIGGLLTGINSIDVTPQAEVDGPHYNLKGQLVDENYRGLVITKGSKTFVK